MCFSFLHLKHVHFTLIDVQSSAEYIYLVAEQRNLPSPVLAAPSLGRKICTCCCLLCRIPEPRNSVCRIGVLCWFSLAGAQPVQHDHPQLYRPGNKTENWLCLSARVDVLRFRRQRCKLYLMRVLILWTFFLTKNCYTYFVPVLMIFIWQNSVVSITVFTWFIDSEYVVHYIFYVNQPPKNTSNHPVVRPI